MRSIFSLVVLVLMAPDCLAHGGGLDKHGCHNDRKSGGYHCHRASVPAPASALPAGPTSPSAVSRRSGASHEATEVPIASAVKAGSAAEAATHGGQVWLGDNAARIYFKAGCEASRLIPSSRVVKIEKEDTLKAMGYVRSSEPGC